MQELSQEMVDMVFSLAELGFQENETAEYITGILEDEGFPHRDRLRGDANLLCGNVGERESGDRDHG